MVSIAKEHQTEDSKTNGYVIDTESLRKEHDIDLRGNEDVSLGRIFKPRLLKGTCDVRITNNTVVSLARTIQVR